MCRLALTDADRDGRDRLVAWMRELGLEVRVDRIGNIFGLRAGTRPELAPVMTGSHLDTVATGGRYDGLYGVMAGLEVVRELGERGAATARTLVVAAFTNEEGVRFAPDMMGSLVYAGGYPLEAALDTVGTDGARLGDELARIGYAGAMDCGAIVPHAFVELHIEQGPVLEDEGIVIGAVTGVQGISWTELVLTGQSAHAGTTPMRLRHDAGYVAAEITAGVRSIARQMGGAQVATVGRCELEPDLVNVVAGRVTMTVDLRNTDEHLLQQAEDRFRHLVQDVAGDEGVTVQSRSLARFEPVDFDARMIDLVESTARRLGHSTRRMPSGAGHDAQMLARICPTGMIFVPSVNGLSHNIAELTLPEHLDAGANTLLHVVLSLAT